jgi:hypothetical protein
VENKKQGKGMYKTNTIVINGTFHNNKPHGEEIHVSQYSYEYHGAYINGLKDGKGLEVSTYLDNQYQYEGMFKCDKFDGLGIYVNHGNAGYKYEGHFTNGLPSSIYLVMQYILTNSEYCFQLPSSPNSLFPNPSSP